jgi:hypothetical protein
VEQARTALQGLKSINLPRYYVKVDLGRKGTWWRLYVGYFESAKAAMAARETHGLPESIVQKTPYANRVGVYDSPSELTAMHKRLADMAYSPYVIRKSAEAYQLLVGAFVTLKGAQDLQNELGLNGISSEVVER